MQVQRIVGLAAGAVAVILLAIAQFTPWGGVDASFGSFSAEADAYVWEAKYEARAFGENERDSKGWYSEEFDEENGSGKVRTGAPLLVSSLGLAALGTALVGILRPPAGAIVLLLAVAVGIAGIIVFSIGVDDLFDGEQDWGPAFYLAIIGTVLALLGALASLVPDRMMPKPRPRAPSNGPSY